MKQFEATVILLENGKDVKYKYIVRNVVNYGDAEKVITKYMEDESLQDIEPIKPTKYAEWILLSDEDKETVECSKFFKVTVAFVTVDEKSAKEKVTKFNYLIEGSDFNDAKDSLENFMKGTLSDWKHSAWKELEIEGVIDGVKIIAEEEEENENID